MSSCQGSDILDILKCNVAFDFSEICPFFVRDYVRSELESGYEGPVYLEPLSMNRFTTALISKKKKT